MIEQRNLLWGSEVSTSLPGTRGKPARVVHVDEEHVGFATALALVVEHGRRATGPKVRRCPRCGHRGQVDRDFGTRVLNGRRRPQSWCRSCRAAHHSSAQPVRAERAAPEAGWLF